MNVMCFPSAQCSFQPSSPEPKEQETEESLTSSQEEHLGKSLDSCKQLPGDSNTHNINSNMSGKKDSLLTFIQTRIPSDKI